MDLERLQKMAEIILKDLARVERGTAEFGAYRTIHAKIKNLFATALKTFPDYAEFFKTLSEEWKDLDIYDVKEAVQYVTQIMEIEKASESKSEGMKIFESAEEKMKQVNLAFRKGDYTSCFNNLNTSLELVLKDKLRIPLTITKVNTAKIVDILVKHKVEPYLFLDESKKHITDIANKIKHSGYVPSKSDCIFAIKAMEELIAQLKATEIKLTEEVRNKIYKGL